MQDATYEDAFGALERRRQRGARALRWAGKTLLGVPRKILVELRWRLGDEIMALPIFETLRERYPADHIAVLTNYPVLFENHPFVDAINAIPKPVDRYLLLRGADRRKYRIEEYARHAGVRCPVLRPHLYFADWHAPQLSELPGGDGPIIALAAGASWPTKRWPMERWRELAARLEAHGARLLELGQGHSPIGAGLCLLDRTTVREAACILHAADLLICCDSGLMHLALAANTSAVALFGPTDPRILIRDEPHLHAIESTLPCQGWWNRAEGDPAPGTCPWNHPCCLDTIGVEAVLEAVKQCIILPR